MVRKWWIGAAMIALGMGAYAWAAAPASATATATATAPAMVPASRPAAMPLLVEAPDRAAPRHMAGGRDSTSWKDRHDALVAKARTGNIDLYFMGDSITDFWETRYGTNWHQNFDGWKAADFGISGDRTQHVLWRLQNGSSAAAATATATATATSPSTQGELDGVKARVIVLLIGTNNLTSNAVFAENSAEDTAGGVRKILDVLRERQPQAKILLMGVFPREDKPLNDKVRQLNELIGKFDDGKQIKFLNIYDQMVDKDGKLLPGVMANDKLHPTEKGYQIWAEAMKPLLTAWLGEPAK